MSLLSTFDSSNPLTQHQHHADSNVSQFPREEVCDILEELLPLLLNWFLQDALAAACWDDFQDTRCQAVEFHMGLLGGSYAFSSEPDPRRCSTCLSCFYIRIHRASFPPVSILEDEAISARLVARTLWMPGRIPHRGWRSHCPMAQFFVHARCYD